MDAQKRLAESGRFETWRRIKKSAKKAAFSGFFLLLFCRCFGRAFFLGSSAIFLLFIAPAPACLPLSCFLFLMPSVSSYLVSTIQHLRVYLVAGFSYARDPCLLAFFQDIQVLFLYMISPKTNPYRIIWTYEHMNKYSYITRKEKECGMKSKVLFTGRDVGWRVRCCLREGMWDEK